MTTAQRVLAADRVEEFYHDRFVTDQVADFIALDPLAGDPNGVLADVGGGCGFFAEAVHRRCGVPARVIDMDAASVEACTRRGVPAVLGDATQPPIRGDERVVSFNLILHHLVSDDERSTRALQVRALRAWHAQARQVFVNEYIYESPGVPRLSGALIYGITHSRLLSALGQAVARFVPSLRANTFGVGVRFRAAAEWRALFEEAGYEVRAHRRGAPEPVSAARRLLAIREIRRDSFLLVPRPAADAPVTP